MVRESDVTVESFTTQHEKSQQLDTCTQYLVAHMDGSHLNVGVRETLAVSVIIILGGESRNVSYPRSVLIRMITEGWSMDSVSVLSIFSPLTEYVPAGRLSNWYAPLWSEIVESIAVTPSAA